MYDKPVAQFGKIIHCKWIGPAPGEDFFVMPKQQSLYAVDIRLLQQVTDELNFGASNFAAATMVWMGQHTEPMQRNEIAGEDYTMLRNTTQRLEDAWFVWEATKSAKGSDAMFEWSFTPDGLEGMFLIYVPLLREEHIQTVIAHIPGCPRCSAKIVLILDGKMGACRRVCANMNGFWSMPDIGVVLNSGCTRQAAPGRLRCACCKPQAVEAPIPQKVVKGMRQTVFDDEVAMEYLVTCHDPDGGPDCDIYLPRSEILPTLLQEWEDRMLLVKGSQTSSSSKDADDVHGDSTPALSSQKNIRKARKKTCHHQL